MFRNIKIEKVVLNIGCGTTLNIDNAKKILENISGKKPVTTFSRKRSTFGVPKHKEIGVKVTIRDKPDVLLARLLVATENKLKAGSFNDNGNFSFGVKEYIDVPEAEYEPKIGIIGFDVCVSLYRYGYSIKNKRIPSKIGKKHLITKDEAMDFIKEKFKVEIV